jgi:7-carboxy-7-deazaguanine synthase
MPCTFVRLAGCNLQCGYCDTAEAARAAGSLRSIASICKDIDAAGLPLVEITGGEPLVQHQTPALCDMLCSRGHSVLVETNGSRDISVLPADVAVIMDIKCPSSGMDAHFRAANVTRLRNKDECKFVIADHTDFVWAMRRTDELALTSRCTVNFSPVHGRLDAARLAEWILQHNLPVRLNVQLHRMIWPHSTRER